MRDSVGILRPPYFTPKHFVDYCSRNSFDTPMNGMIISANVILRARSHPMQCTKNLLARRQSFVSCRWMFNTCTDSIYYMFYTYFTNTEFFLKWKIRKIKRKINYFLNLLLYAKSSRSLLLSLASLLLAWRAIMNYAYVNHEILQLSRNSTQL